MCVHRIIVHYSKKHLNISFFSITSLLSCRICIAHHLTPLCPIASHLCLSDKSRITQILKHTLLEHHGRHSLFVLPIQRDRGGGYTLSEKCGYSDRHVTLPYFFLYNLFCFCKCVYVSVCYNVQGYHLRM